MSTSLRRFTYLYLALTNFLRNEYFSLCVVTSATEDPLCRLHKHRRIRVCSQIFNAYNFDKEVSFTPIAENVSDDCEMKRISFFEDDLEKEASGFTFEEWMVGCKVERIFSGYEFIYWLSRGYRSSEVFVYKYDFHSGKLVIDSLSVHVRLVYDETDSKVINPCTK